MGKQGLPSSINGLSARARKNYAQRVVAYTAKALRMSAEDAALELAELDERRRVVAKRAAVLKKDALAAALKKEAELRALSADALGQMADDVAAIVAQVGTTAAKWARNSGTQQTRFHFF